MNAWTLLLIAVRSKYIWCRYNKHLPVACSGEAKSVVEDKLSEFSVSLLAAYDSGDLIAALEEGHAGWQKWVKGFGKSLKRKVS